MPLKDGKVLPEVLGLLQALRDAGAVKVELHPEGGVKAVEFAPGGPMPEGESEEREDNPTPTELAVRQVITRKFQRVGES